MGLFGKGVARICAVVAASSAREMAAQLRRALRETPTVELRLDWLKSDSERRRFLAWLRRNPLPRAVLLATCRRREGGGLFAGSVQDELRWLTGPCQTIYSRRDALERTHWKKVCRSMQDD